MRKTLLVDNSFLVDQGSPIPEVSAVRNYLASERLARRCHA
ncbi:MAG: hypothetical protein ACQEUN_04730 [Pseudomonadota bacterium]